jgi:cytochrome c peroxidase
MRLILLPLLLAMSACVAPPATIDRTPGQTGSSIALLPDGKRLVVVDPDQGSVSIVDADTLVALGRVDVGGEPHQLLVADNLVLVTTYRGGELVAIDPDSQKVVNRVHVCAGPWGLARAPAGWLAVGCEWQGEVRKVSADFQKNETLGAVWRVRAVAVQGETVRAANFAGPDVRIWSFGPDGTQSLRPVPDGLADGRKDLQNMAPTQVTALLPLADGGLVASLQLVANQSQSDAQKPSGYGGLADGEPRVNPVVLHLDPTNRIAGPVTYARFDETGRAFNAPSAIAQVSQNRLIVAHLSSNDVVQLDLTAAESNARFVQRQPTAAGPRGIAVSPERGMAWIDDAFDYAVTRVPLDVMLGGPVADTRTRDLPARYSASARAGRKAFHDATNRHLTPLGVVACNSCHADGGDDGLVWHFHAGTVTPRARRSQHLGVAPVGMAGLHWDGEFANLFDLMESTVPNLMGGDALLLDSSDFTAYLHEIVQPPEPPPGDTAAIARGKALFESPALDCVHCHSGANYTDLQAHIALLPTSTTPGDTLKAVRTPSLRGVFLRAPYFHDGRAADLFALHKRTDLLEHADMSGLPDAEMADLVAFLKSL